MNAFAAPQILTSHPWIVVFDRLADARAFVVGGTVLRALVAGGREPRDLDVQYGGCDGDALALQESLRSAGVPANVRSLETPGTNDMMSFGACWRRVKYQSGTVIADDLAMPFLNDRIAIIDGAAPDAALAHKSAKWVLLEYPARRLRSAENNS